MKNYISTINMTHDEWLQIRKKSIGGSDISAIMGLNKWKSPLQVYNEKTGITETESANSEAAYWGNTLENIVAQEFSKVTGKKIRRRNAILYNIDFPYMSANIDREIVGENAVLEIKTTSAFNSDEWKGDNIPDMYILQVHWYMMVNDYQKGFIACLIGGQRLIWKEIERDEELIDMMKTAAINFWENHVLKSIPPKATAADNETIPDNLNIAEIELPEDVDSLIVSLNSKKEEIKAIEQEKNEIEAQIKQQLQNHAKGETPKYIISWGENQNRFDSKAFKQDNPELAERYVKQLFINKLSIKEKRA